MRKETFKALVTVGLVVVLILGYTAVLFFDNTEGLAASVQEKQTKPVYKPVVELEVVMEQVDEMFMELEENLEKEKFRTLRKQSAFLAEMMNLTSYYDHTKFNKEKGWKEMSVASRTLLLQAAEVAKKKDGKAFEELIKKIDDSCEVCHDKYQD